MCIRDSHPGERLGLPRQARAGGRLRLPARDRSRRGDAGGRRLCRRHRSVHACPSSGPEPRAPAGALTSRGSDLHPMTRVLILSWEYPPLIEGGLARHVRKLSEALVEREVEVHVLTRGGEESPAEERSGGVSIHRIREPTRPTDLGEFVAWVERMNSDMLAAGVELGDRYEFDLVHGHDWLVANACDHLAKRLGAPVGTTINATENGRHQGG